MINWFDMPAEGLSNGGLFEVKELEVTENGTYETKGEMYNKVTVNVEGGGGSSDFSTAEVEFKNQTTSMLTIKTVNINNDKLIGEILLGDTATATRTLVLYKGSQQVVIPFGVESVTATGDITVDDEEGVIIINGSGTVVFKP